MEPKRRNIGKFSVASPNIRSVSVGPSRDNQSTRFGNDSDSAFTEIADDTRYSNTSDYQNTWPRYRCAFCGVNEPGKARRQHCHQGTVGKNPRDWAGLSRAHY